MSNIVNFRSIDVARLDKPLVAHYDTHDVLLNYKVTINFAGSAHSANLECFADVLEFIKENSQIVEHTWEEITSNGQFSCD